MNLIILGAGGYGRTIADIAEQRGIYEKILFLDDNAESAIGKCNDWEIYKSGNLFYPAFGNNKLRLEWMDIIEKNGGEIASIFHKTAYVSPKAKVKNGVMILPNAVVNTDVIIERGCIINCNAVIDHGCVIEEGVHICLGAIVKGENRIEKFKKIEAGEVIQLREFPVDGGKQ